MPSDATAESNFRLDSAYQQEASMLHANDGHTYTTSRWEPILSHQRKGSTSCRHSHRRYLAVAGHSSGDVCGPALVTPEADMEELGRRDHGDRSCTFLCSLLSTKGSLRMRPDF